MNYDQCSEPPYNAMWETIESELRCISYTKMREELEDWGHPYPWMISAEHLDGVWTEWRIEEWHKELEFTHGGRI